MKGDWGILELFRIRKSWQNVNPIGWIFFFAIIAIIIGLLVNSISVLAIIGAFIIFMFLAYFIVWWLNL